MDSANGFKCVICYDSICCDSAKSKSINLTCGHAFGKSCMRKWMESSNQKECLLCKNPLTDNEIKAIKSIPLQERVIVILEKTTELIGRTILEFAPAFATVGITTVVVGGVTGGASGAVLAVAPVAAAAAGVAAGAVGAAAGVNRFAGGAAAAAFGAVMASGAVVASRAVEASGAVEATTGFTAWDVGCTATIGLAVSVVGVFLADIVYDEQEMDPVVM